jgi:ABC-type transport system involved in cytochrome bd biosynthesis fused ATPase/permease subunit
MFHLMPSPLVPIGLFVALVLSVIAGLTAGGAALGLLAVCGFMASLGALAWAVLRADRAADPRHGMLRAADRFEERWHDFERDFWAHVSAREAAK